MASVQVASRYESGSDSDGYGTEEANGGWCGGGFGAGGESSDEKDAAQWSVLHGHVPAYIRNNFVKKVYTILSVQLLITIGISWLIMSIPAEDLVNVNWGMWVQLDCVLVLALTCGLSCCCQEQMRTFPQNYFFLFLLTVLMSVLTGTICLAYDTQSVLMAVGLTMGIFFALTAYACLTKTDFTGAGPYLFVVMTCLMFASFLYFFFPSKVFDIVISVVGCLLFSFYIIYDTQLIVGGAHNKHKFAVDDYCFAALAIYLDIINLFLYILRFFGGRSD